MDYKELENYVKMAKEGNQEAMLIILELFKPFIFKTAQKYNISSQDLFDLHQTANLSLLKAIEKYELGRMTFKSYGYTTISNSLKYLARQNKKSLLSLNDKAPESNKEFISILLDQTDIEDDFMRSEDSSRLRKIISSMATEDIELIYSLYHFGVSLKTYSERKGICYITAVRRKNKILKYLKDKITLNEI